MSLGSVPSSTREEPPSGKSSEGYAGPRESSAERHKKVKALNLSVFDLFDRSKPWVLVENGSILGYFDWVPLRLRVGPWSPVAPAMLFVMIYFVICGNAVAFQQPSPTNGNGYPEYGSGLWYYNVLVFVWMNIISLTVYFGPAGWRPWATYTMWSWTILQMRHGLAALAPWLQPDSFLFQLLEISRFPILAMHSITFVVWNFVLMPFVYFFFMDNAVKRQNFLAYFTKFRLIQLHVFNIFFAYMNGVVVSPPRLLLFRDFMAGLTIGIFYILLYLLVMDRVGVHLYPIFSPRSSWVVGTWFFMVSCYVTCFYGWKAILAPTGN